MDCKSENVLCSIVITCEEMNREGEMKVKMEHIGDHVLTSYLLETASEQIASNIARDLENEYTKEKPNNKILKFAACCD